LLRVNQMIAGLALIFFCQGLTNLVGTIAGWTNYRLPALPPRHIRDPHSLYNLAP